MAAQGGEIYRRAIRLTSFASGDSRKLMKDLLDQYESVASISQAQLNFLMGVTEFYRARTDTKMTIAAERLAVIAAVTLPITATSSIVGMNVIVNDQTHWVVADDPARLHGHNVVRPAALGEAAGLVVRPVSRGVGRSL